MSVSGQEQKETAHCERQRRMQTVCKNRNKGEFYDAKEKDSSQNFSAPGEPG